jgi:putative ATP-binding cassette transporter
LLFARLLVAEPDFAFLDHATSALTERQQTALYRSLADTAITYVSVADGHARLREQCNTNLELQSDGTLAGVAAASERRSS